MQPVNPVLAKTLIATLILSIGGCSTLNFGNMNKSVCQADKNCSYICPDGSKTDPRNPHCTDPSMGKSGY